MGSMSVSSCRCCVFVSILWQFSMLHDLQFVSAGQGCKRRLYGRDILQSRSHDCLIRPRTFGCVAMCSAVLFIFIGPDRSYILQGVNRVHVVLSGFSIRLFCFVQKKNENLTAHQRIF